MNYLFQALTHPGLLRNNNEDAAAFDPACGLGVLADGMGGYNAGEVASSMAVNVILSELADWFAVSGQVTSVREIRKAVDRCVQHANQAILSTARADPDCAGMGTTLVVAVFQDQRLVVGHIGDSRAYRLRDQQLQQITRDHSLLQEQLDAGLITPAQAAVSSQRNLVTRALGIEQGVELELNEFAVEAGDLYLLCSDGLSDMVSDSDIGDILRAAGSLEHKARRLVDCANANGGRDNITVLLVHAPASSPTRQGLVSRLLRT
ncbi:Stp1/IreP family PP2C-type Ser/Thr phosphatase [Pseudorhodoferax sp. Leaf274]|uniref:Stp1/IreP family PP2C-type Ser/Thr phosphatase n=1 Tax=Pseudorhodoferax sp. Leaf274 TaxID=1736318 RepID=UPI000702EA32|nr:Stp1/IreP family PP2C-type Ser/Thr phosphatase [Pseudorhodoferax sp. Leaf274]KQP47611.1 protein phosphatase [Pseudorhodoferax sp. Leaf274]